VVAAVALALPLAAQENQGNQPILNRVEGSNLDLGSLQRTGPGGDLEHAVKVSSLDVANPSCTPLCSECHWLDAYNPVNTYDPGVAGSEMINYFSTTNDLVSGSLYLITISGTVSYWGFSYYTAPIGSPEPHPMFPSPAVASALQGDVASDWEYLFAYPNNGHGNLFPSGPGHQVGRNISLDNGLTYQDLAPVNGQVYNGAHVYRYLVWGQGKKAQFRVTDKGPHNDNYGQYWICVQLVTPCGTIAPPQ
jgi:hypothetical protein